MRKLVTSLCIVSLILIAGCATPYWKKGFMGGYEDTQLQEDTFRVSFYGNGYTRADKVSDYCLRRAAEVCLENGYDYFLIMDQADYSKKLLYTTPTTVSGQSNTRGTYTDNSFRSTTTGQATVYSGQTYLFSKPSKTLIIKCFKGTKPDEGLNAWDAHQLKAGFK